MLHHKVIIKHLHHDNKNELQNENVLDRPLKEKIRRIEIIISFFFFFCKKVLLHKFNNTIERFREYLFLHLFSVQKE
jgi:hypothetical protein